LCDVGSSPSAYAKLEKSHRSLVINYLVYKAMSKVSPPQGEQTTQHPLEAVIDELDSLLEKLRMELDVAPTDQKAHQDLLRRIIWASERGLQIPAETYPKPPKLAGAEIHKLTLEDLEFLESVEWLS
jgi:hypothetical protein